MTYENYQETNPYKYKLSNGEIITNVEYESLLRSFKADYNSIIDYATEQEKEKITNLYRNVEFEANIEGDDKYKTAMEFDKIARFVAYTHFNSNKQVFEKNRTNAFETWFDDITEEQKAEIRKQNNKKVEQQILKENEQEENLEYETIIHSKDFIEKFGDWEKAQRLEVLKKDKVIEKKSTVIVNDIDITKKIEIARKNNDSKTLRQYADMIAIDAKGTYPLKDLNNIPIMVSGKTIKESKIHITDPYQVEALTFIPDILNNGRFISHEKNEDVITHPEIKSYDYVICGLKINNEDFTAKSVIANDNNGNRYYDHQLSKIEKGKLLDVLNPLTSRDSLSNLPNIKDKRLLRVCQVSQRPYLDENLKPTQEAVKLVQEGKLYLEKDPVTGFTSMCNENECNHKILQFRKMFNAQQKPYEPKITYENAETILTNNVLSLDKLTMSKDLNDFIEYTEMDDVYDDEERKFVHLESVESLSPRKILDRCIYKIDDLENRNLSINEKLTNIKKLDEQNYHAEKCSKIIENWIDACGVLGETKDFENVMNHAKDSFKQNIENAKNNLSILDETSPLRKSAENLVSFNKDEFEYFKHNAKPLFDNAVENIRVRDEINKQKELSQKAELDVWIEKAEKDNKQIIKLTEEVEQQEKTIQKQNQLLYGETKVEVNGVTRICPNGIVEGFAKSVARNDEQNQRIIRQNQKIENLNNYIDSITNTKDSINPNKPEPKAPKSQGDDGMSY